MPTVLKDIDGGRSVNIRAKGGSIFLWTDKDCWEFDSKLFSHAITRALWRDHAEMAELHPPMSAADAIIT